MSIFDGAALFETMRDGDIILVPMRVGKPAAPNRSITITPLQKDAVSIWQTGPDALILLNDCRWTCSMCRRYQPFRDIPNSGYCECERKVMAFQESCVNFKGR